VDKPIIGVVGPFSGPRACYGDMLKKQIKQSKLCEEMQIILADDEANPIRSAKIADFLVSKNVLAVIGHFNSASASVASKIYSKAGIPLILPASTSPVLTKIPLTFRMCPHDNNQIAAIFNFLRKHLPARVAIWTDESRYGLSLRRKLIQQFQDNDIKWVDPNELKESDLLVCLGSHYKVAETLRKLKNTYPHLTAICCDDCAINEFKLLLNNIKNIWVITPHPDFSICVKQSFELILSYFTTHSTLSFGSWLARPDGLFRKQENPSAFFHTVQVKEL
jgi:branched-chain amino acid transport system substrate-binding protein